MSRIIIGAYAHVDGGKTTLSEAILHMCGVLKENVDYATEFIRKHFKGVSAAKPEGTYMLFLDCEQWCKEHGCTLEALERKGWRVGVAWQDGAMFRSPWAIRMNLALPLARVKEAMERLKKYVFTE